MIVFYNTTTGKIIGTIGGRVHNKEHLKMWIGDKSDTARIVINYKPTGEKQTRIVESIDYEETGVVDEFGEDMYRKVLKKEKIEYRQYRPDCKQPEIIDEMEQDISAINKYKIDVKSKKFIKNE